MYINEEQAEIAMLPMLATNLSDGMTVLTAQNLSKPINTFGAIPDELRDVPEFVSGFLAWQRGRVTSAPHRIMWETPGVERDTIMYVARKTWQSKLERNEIAHDVVRVMVVTISLQKSIRSYVYESINDVATHNENVKLLGKAFRDTLDSLMKIRLEEQAGIIAGAALVRIPELQKQLEDQTNG